MSRADDAVLREFFCFECKGRGAKKSQKELTT